MANDDRSASRNILQPLLAMSRAIDEVNELVGHGVKWLVFVAALLCAGNATVRYAFNWSSNGLLEAQWYLFSAVFLLYAAAALKRNLHVRIDILAGRLSPKGHAMLDILGALFFLLPIAWIVMTLGWHMFEASYASGEMSNDPGGLIRWPVKLMVPAGFVLLIAQAASEIIKRVAFLAGVIGDPTPRHTLDDTSELEAAIQSHTASVDKP